MDQKKTTTDLGMKPTNPKDAIGSSKLPLHLWPTTATALGCLGFLDGALKYGKNNWRGTGAKASIYVDAAKRHLDAWYEGEQLDPDSGVPHLAHALACIAIIVDAAVAGKLVDDRAYSQGGYRRLVTAMTPHVERLKAKHADKTPKHWLIDDARSAASHDPVVHVVVAVMLDKRGRVFLQRRNDCDANFPGCVECPGGGVEPGESDYEAICRELREELGVRVVTFDAAPIWRGQIEGYRGLRFDFRFYRVLAWVGAPRALDGQKLVGWKTPSQAAQLALTPANRLAWDAIDDAACARRRRR